MADPSAPFRDIVASRLRADLVGPLSENETLTDRPTQRYSTGILYPLDSRIEAEEDQDLDLEVNVSEDSASDPDTDGVPLYTALKPSAAGMSFAIKPLDSQSIPEVTFRVACATYKCFATDDEGQEVDESRPDRDHERWRRVSHVVSVPARIAPGQCRVDLGPEGIEQLELYVLVTPYADLLTVTAALSNKRVRGKHEGIRRGAAFLSSRPRGRWR